MDGIFVKSEFAPLKRVVLAQSEFSFPEKGGLEEADFLTQENRALYSKKNIQGKSFKEAFPKRQIAWEIERENLKKMLEKYEVDVERPRLLTTDEKEVGKTHGYSNFFVRDPFFTVGPFLIEGSLKLAHRRNEVLPVRELLISESNKNSCLYLSIPKPGTSNIHEQLGPFLEGGDILILNDTIFVGNSGLASNSKGINWLSNLVSNFGYQVVEIALHPSILHLDCAMSLVRDGLMIVCEEALLEGIPEQFKNWDKIFVTLADASRLATNGLSINEEVYITDPEFKFIGNELEKRGITVEYIDFKISRSFGGSFRCTTQPLLRIDEKREES